MTKKKFTFLLIGIIVLIILTFTLQALFLNQTKNFGISCGALFLSTFCLFCYKDALNPTKGGLGRPINMTKKYYEKKGDLRKYQNLCKILFIITIGVGTLCLLLGLCEIFINYLFSVLQI